ncbi:MAG: tetratricopeptide repeat protein [Gomphosphaeria aponina SAG 52.96 = DSM 107014]|uniref:Tetratricopeptide repeat protein n=1 Tax=Gomphosphaeria aponina SAG 52.96 = DSM 107014 TaxID=1521640 RepID=A0A941JSJ9_9CHRO|nr:tetratricopeptide repeat protein [Gomphosphaeria aponina SAG 52.96 = DSM 107014]
MLSQIKDWLEKQHLFTQNITQKQDHREDLPQLTDTDYEFLFSQLLEGVANGWHEGRIVKFFERLGDRGDLRQWIKWLKSFEKKLLTSSTPNRQLATRMLRLGHITESLPFPEMKNLGNIVYQIGVQLLNKGTNNSNEDLRAEAGIIQKQEIQREHEIQIPIQEDRPSVTLSSLDEFFVNLEQEAKLLNLEEMLKQLNQINNEPEKSKLNPEPVSAWFNLGIMQAERGDLENAIVAWEQTLQLAPNNALAWHNLGSVLGELGRYTEALACFERAIKLNPQEYSSWNNRGNALYNLKKWEKAIASWDKALSLQPEYYQAWYNRACALENLERFEESLASYNKALEIKPDFPLAKYRRSNLLR